MSDQNNSNTLQKIKKFSRFITTKVKEKTQSKSQNDVEDDEEDEDALFQDAMIVRRHSSYIYQPTKREDQATITLKEDLYQHYHTLPPTMPPTTSALSPPPRQMRSKTVRADNDNTDDKTTNVISNKPCLSRSNTLGHHTPIRSTPIHHSSFSTTTMSSSSSSFIMTSPPSSTSLSSLSGRCNVNHTLIN